MRWHSALVELECYDRRGIAAVQSITLGGSARRPQPVMELAMAKEEVKARLATVPVFTVANPKNEFVLVAGEVRRGVAAMREGEGLEAEWGAVG